MRTCSSELISSCEQHGRRFSSCRSFWRVRTNFDGSSADLAGISYQRLGQDCLVVRFDFGVADGSCGRGSRRVLAMMMRFVLTPLSLVLFSDDLSCSFRACAQLLIISQRIACLPLSCFITVPHSFAHLACQLGSRGIQRCFVPLSTFVRADLRAFFRRAHLPPPRRSRCLSGLSFFREATPPRAMTDDESVRMSSNSDGWNPLVSIPFRNVFWVLLMEFACATDTLRVWETCVFCRSPEHDVTACSGENA